MRASGGYLAAMASSRMTPLTRFLLLLLLMAGIFALVYVLLESGTVTLPPPR